MVKESKYCIAVMKKHFNKELVITKEDDQNVESSTKRWIYDSDVRIRDYFHVTRKYRVLHMEIVISKSV